MKLKTFKPTTPSSRNLIRLNNIDLQNSPLLKNQIKGSKNSAGKNSTGRITAYLRGG